MAHNGSAILALKGEAVGLQNNVRPEQTYVMPPASILFSSLLQLVFNNKRKIKPHKPVED